MAIATPVVGTFSMYYYTYTFYKTIDVAIYYVRIGVYILLVNKVAEEIWGKIGRSNCLLHE